MERMERRTSETKTTNVQASRAPVRHRREWPDVQPEQCFWVHDGQVLKNLAELPAALRQMSPETFSHHVNNEKNDFANWIHDVIGDRELAEDIRRHNSRVEIIKAVQSRL